MINKKEIAECFKVSGVSKDAYFIQPIVKGKEYEVTIYPNATNYTYMVVATLNRYLNVISDTGTSILGKRVLVLQSR